MHGIIILLQSVNILLFGHSFGQDCTEHLPAMAVEAGIENLHIGRFIKANCSLEEHWEFLESDTTAFYSESLPGERVYTRRAMSVKQVLESTAWDYVIFQNSLENEGR